MSYDNNVDYVPAACLLQVRFVVVRNTYSRGSQPGCRDTLGYREIKFRVPQKYLKYIFFFKRLHEKYSTVSNKTDYMFIV
jgi:hypothetical protein